MTRCLLNKAPASRTRARVPLNIVTCMRNDRRVSSNHNDTATFDPVSFAAFVTIMIPLCSIAADMGMPNEKSHEAEILHCDPYSAFLWCLFDQIVD